LEEKNGKIEDRRIKKNQTQKNKNGLGKRREESWGVCLPSLLDEKISCTKKRGRGRVGVLE